MESKKVKIRSKNCLLSW